MKHENDINVKATFEISDRSTGKIIKREITTEYYPGNHFQDESTIIRKSMKKILAEISKLKPVKETKA